jgi:hypothetical protein
VNVHACTLVIDLSNICRDDRLVPVGRDTDWNRLQLLLDAIDGLENVSYSGIHLVADRTLRKRLDDGGKRELRRAESGGYLELQEFADERLVELTFGSSSIANPLLVTNDFLDDFRRTYPELDESRSHRVGAGRGWAAQAERTDVRKANPPSRIAKGRGGRTAAPAPSATGGFKNRLLVGTTNAPTRVAWVAAFWPDHLEELPEYDADAREFVCPGCGAHLKRSGERQPAVQIIVYHSDREVARLLIETGIEVGRADARRCIGLARFLSAHDVAAVSRRHLQIFVEGDRVEVEDLGSKNGTRIEPRVQGRLPTDLAPGARVAWKLRDAVSLPGEVRLERSGRRLPVTGDGPLTSPTGEADPTATRLASREPT